MLKNICAGLMSAALLTGGLTTYVGAEPVHVPTLADMSVQVKEPTVQEQRLAQETGKAVASAPVAPVAEQPAAATTAAAEVKKAEPAVAEPEKKSLEKKISINLAARSLALFEGTEKIRLYPIGPGTPYTPTPVGYYKIQSKDVNPSWTSPSTGKTIPSGPDCPLGYRWMQIQGNYGIHGTNNPDSIGHYVSNGCIRMHEKDVEALFDLVKIGTPVEITYNRVVVEKLADNTVVYYIYPDGYGWQNLSVDDVNKWLAGYGVANFVSNEEIEKKISASDGEPTYVAKVYPLYVNGEKMKNKAVEQNGVMYLPAIDLADAVHVDLGWNDKTQKLISTLGAADGVDKKDVLYCKLADAKTLFKLDGAVEKNNFVMKFVPDEKKSNLDSREEKVDATQKIDHKVVSVAQQEIGQVKNEKVSNKDKTKK
ncbi:MAG: L,D-transpeptidase [Selenomonas ruminantium]|jgi:lipoprotein-anchoring transpeptidase ErfK/SrfK|uniref:L,D-transpeptidase n=1 Tax=Selenomonas ruminantium TaxID=971 RepID=A0A927WM61_SELRU|nr:L,D-transpeptidase [Selenomonas ruminantium]